MELVDSFVVATLAFVDKAAELDPLDHHIQYSDTLAAVAA
jgi:hypothetical protein